MLPTFVIGLREGVEAALIVGIVAAFLRRQHARRALRWMWTGVGLAVVICAAGGVALELRLGQLDAGLFFISFQRHLGAFVRLQRRLAQHDALSEYVTRTGSAVFACPPGARWPGDYVGSGLFE